MRILLLTQYFAPEPAGKLVDLARELQRHGHEVQVLTSFPCYPHGKIYKGYRQSMWSREEIDGIDVIRVPQFPDRSRSSIKRAIYYCSFALSAVTLGFFRTKRPEVILVYQSALPTGLAAWLLSRFRRVPYVVDLADLWPESIAASGMLRSRTMLNTIRSVAKFVYKRATEINVITKGYRSSLLQMGIADSKINLVRWWQPEGTSLKRDRDEAFAEREGFACKFNIVYAGTIGPCQQLETVLEAAAMLRDLTEVQFTIAGEGVARSELCRRADEMNLENVRFIGRRNLDDVAKMFALSELLLIHLKHDEMSELSIPSKTIDYLASGRPLLMAVAGEASKLVDQCGCGITVPPSDPKRMAEAIRRFYSLSQADRDEFANAARVASQQYFSREDQIGKIEDSLHRAIHLRRRQSWYRRYGKRLMDLTVGVSSLILLFPILLFVSLLIRCVMGSPVLFKQQRPGQGGRLFWIYKLRTMRDAYDAQGEPLSDEQRLTWLGRCLRESSLDELPELWNVIRGEMSLVGPRPLLPAYLDHYTPEQARRHEVKPGLTGLAQVSGRNAIDWEQKFRLDVDYVDNVSLWLDLRILFQTVWSVIRRSGVSAEGHATMPEYLGPEVRREPVERRAA